MTLSDTTVNESRTRRLQSEVTLLSGRSLGGYVFDRDDFCRRFVVELLIDGSPMQIARASLYDIGLDKAGWGDGCYRFLFTLPAGALQAAQSLEVRLANEDHSLGAPILLPASGENARLGASVRWIGGLRFSGWLDAAQGSPRKVSAFVDGVLAAEALASGWTQAGEGADSRAARAFDLHLPRELADGRARLARIIDESGAELPGSPCAFAAFEGGLERFLDEGAEIDSDKLRARFFERLLPQSLPFSMFAAWAEAFPLAAGPAPKLRIAAALIGDEQAEASLASLGAQQDCACVTTVLAGGAPGAFDNDGLRQFLADEAGDCDIIVFAPAGAIFSPGALSALAEALAAHPDALLAYGDVTVAAEDGADWPLALPAFDYERMLEQGYGALLFALRASAACAAAEQGVSDMFRLFNCTLDGEGALGGPVHVPGFLARVPLFDSVDASPLLAQATLAHLQARGVTASVAPGFGALLPAARVSRQPPSGKVSILIPTRDRVDLLRPCVASLQRTVDFDRHEVIVLDNDTSDPETLAYFDSLAPTPVRILRVGGAFNFARLINAGASAAAGEFLLLLNNDVEALEPGWLDEMLGRMAESDVGAVGATLLWPSRVVQHAGVVLGPGFAVEHAFSDAIDGDPGYGDALRVAHECSAVTAACLLTRKQAFDDVGGFDDLRFPVNFNDVDFCLKLRALGLRIVQTPYARLLHRESSSRGADTRPDKADRFQRELRNLRAAWGEALMADPYYNPMLSLDRLAFSALAWPPRDARARRRQAVARRPIPPGF